MLLRFGWKALSAALVVAVVVLGGAWYGVSSYTHSSEFCGTACHTMDEQYAAWKTNPHNAANNAQGKQAECVDCHYGGETGIRTQLVGLRHLAAYFVDKKAHLPIRAKILDQYCLNCHPKDEIQDKEVPFLDKIKFKHRAHFEKTIEGQGDHVYCDTCHVKRTKGKHFEVPKGICFTCHFNRKHPEGEPPLDHRAELIQIKFGVSGNDFKEGRSKCTVCHDLPTKPLQQQLTGDEPGKTPITHQTLDQNGAACEGCHVGIVRGRGALRREGCFLECHNESPELVAKIDDLKLMHTEHVQGRRADCKDCHTPIEHGKPEKHYLDVIRNECKACHDENQHKYQRLLIAGTPIIEGDNPAPGLMDKVNTNCLGCHTEEKRPRGHKVMVGTGKSCAACHGPKQGEMLDDWKQAVDKEVSYTVEVETEAVEAIAAAEGKAAAEKLAEAKRLAAEGTKLLDVVRWGNGVHNKKYSISILDEAIGRFEDAMDLLSEEG